MYLSSFHLPIREEEWLIQRKMIENGGKRFGYVDNIYPCRLFSGKELETVTFDRITIFYGGNGSGKSTLLNLIAQRLGLKRVAPYNSGEMFDMYVDRCRYSMCDDEDGDAMRIPNGSRIITSDDIFDYMLNVRTNNLDIAENRGDAREEWANLKFGETVKMRGMQDYEALRLQVMARKKSVSRRQFIRDTAGDEVKLNSNGETALKYFRTRLKNDTLYCLDEPENSMSPIMQLELVKLLEQMARYCGCQFIIATHSPFLLALEGAKIYDLDTVPVEVRNWWELENTKIYYEFFKRHQKLFEQ